MRFFDAHSDIWTDVTMHRLKGETDIFRKRHLERLKKGDIEGSMFVIWVDPPHTADYAKRTHEIMDCMRAEIAESTAFRIVHNYDEMMQARADGIFYVFIGVEGMAYIGSDLSKIDEYYALGARHAMLTWNEANDLGAGAMSKQNYGLTEIGKQAARMVQDKGMLLDVSHLNEAGFWDIIKLTKKPIIASHSNCRALCNVPRNLTDDQLRAIRDVNGAVGINSFSIFINSDPAQQTVEGLARHVEHMIEVMGIDHVGCGFDFIDFIENGAAISTVDHVESAETAGLRDCSEVPNLVRCFEKLGLNQDELEKIAYKNFHRVIRDTIG